MTDPLSMVLRLLGSVLRIKLVAVALWAFLPASAATQRIALRTGWNLISIQVGMPSTGFTIPEIMAGLDRTNALDAVWSYNAVQRSYTSFQSINNYPSDLAALRPGLGYWVRVTSDAVLTLSGPSWNGAISLIPGWNLVGFPGLNRVAEEAPTLESTFRDRFGKVSQVWTFQSGSSLFGGQRFVGYDTTARPPLGELNSVEPGRGYWVYAGEALSIGPAPALVLAQDTDNSPFAQPIPYVGANPLYLERMVIPAGTEDAATDLNRNGILDDPFTQDFMLFDEGVNLQNVTILNTNSSLLNWSIATATPWLSLSPTNGTTASESDYVSVVVNRNGLTNGSYTGAFTVDFGSAQRVVAVLLRVPTIAGDYRGAATATRVNGSPVSLGKVDLNLSMFMEGDSPATNRFRGVINRDLALLFPQDVFLDGIFYQGNNFSLTTTFEMPAGDRHEPPYATATNLYNYNPFPNSIYRQVTLQGTRTTADRVEGVYVESIVGVLPENRRITVDGTFVLDRSSILPTTRSIYNGRSPTTPVSIGGSGGGISSYTNTLNVPNAVSIQGVRVTVNITYPRPDQLTLTLIGPGPNGMRFVLTNRPSNLAGSATFSLNHFNGTIGEGDWRLVVDWNGSSERGQFNGWDLNLLGLATYTASGTMVSTNTGSIVPAAGATLTLVGGNIIYQMVTPPDGSFSFPSLTENAYTLGVSKLGYQEGSKFFRITRANTNLGNLVLQPLTNATATVLATPTIGAAPLHVTFSPLVPLTTLATLGNNITSSWRFGDGSTLVLTNLASTVAHVYTNGIHTNATLMLRGSTGSPLTFSSPSIHAHALGPNTNIAPHQVDVAFTSPRTHFLHSVAFIGSVAAPVQNIGTPVQSVPTANATTGYFYQESKRDMAAFDIDRFPFFTRGTNVFSPLTGEDTAFFVQPSTPYYTNIMKTPAPPGNLTWQSYTNRDRYRMIVTLGSHVFGTQPASAGNFRLQTGRIEP
jgi:subtilisin-like proprotein convertase family protein